jgi:hypothetical protein
VKREVGWWRREVCGVESKLIIKEGAGGCGISFSARWHGLWMSEDWISQTKNAIQDTAYSNKCLIGFTGLEDVDPLE